MLRCPFNNFSKCDGSCPFSMPDFTGCKLAVLLTQVEGQSRGQLAQLNNVNANLEDMRAKLEAIGARLDAPLPQKGEAPARADQPARNDRSRMATYKDQPRVRLKKPGDQSGTTFTVPSPLAATMAGVLGDRCDCAVTGKGEVLLYEGESKAISLHGGNGATASRTIAIGIEARNLRKLFGEARWIYYKLASSDGGLFRFVPTGEVE